MTWPAEEGIQNATNRKQERYTDLQLLIRQNDWKSHLFTIEVGARGFVAKSTIQMFRALGFFYGDTSRIAKDLMTIAAIVKTFSRTRTSRYYILRLQNP